MPKFPKEYKEVNVETSEDIFTPHYRFDSHGSLIMPFGPYQSIVFATKPGSTDVGVGTRSPSNAPLDDPEAIKSGYLHVTTAIKAGPKLGWVAQMAGGDAEYPFAFYNETTGVYKFYVDKSGNVVMTGTITAIAGHIGGWQILTNTITADTGVCGLNSLVSGFQWRFWAGNATTGSAPFRVRSDGYLVASDAVITGTITASAGAIGGWVIGAVVLQTPSGDVGMNSNITAGDDVRFWAGSGDTVNAPFHVHESGAVHCSDLVVTGGSITGTLIRTSAGTTRVQLNESTNALEVYFGDIKRAILLESYIAFYAADTSLAGSIAGVTTDLINVYAGTDVIWKFERTSSNVGNFSPAASGKTLNLGQTAAGFHFIIMYVDQLGCTLIPDPATCTAGVSTVNLGSGSYWWGAIVTEDLYVYGEIQSHLIAAADTANLGSGAARWGYFYGTNINISGGAVISGGVNLGTSAITNATQISGANGTLSFDQTGRLQISNHFDPPDGGSYNTGGAVRYWGDISYKTMTGRGCLGSFDAGVELRDGRKVSDVKALQSIKVHPTLKTVYGVPRFDYRTMPKAVYKAAVDYQGVVYLRDKDDKPYVMEKGKRIYAQDGAEMTALTSILIGAIKELDNRVKKLE